MPSRAADTKEELDAGITQDQIEQLIAERKQAGATSCDVTEDDGKRFLVCHWPPL